MLCKTLKRFHTATKTTIHKTDSVFIRQKNVRLSQINNIRTKSSVVQCPWPWSIHGLGLVDFFQCSVAGLHQLWQHHKIIFFTHYTRSTQSSINPVCPRTSFGWKVNKHTTRCTSPISAGLAQCNLVSGWGLLKSETEINAAQWAMRLEKDLTLTFYKTVLFARHGIKFDVTYVELNQVTDNEHTDNSATTHNKDVPFN